MDSAEKTEAINAFSELYDTVKTLKDPGGCLWDIRQTHSSLRQYFLEEAYEVLEAIDAGDMASLSEELGDIMLHVLFQYDIAERGGTFSAAESMRGTSQKLIKRHPHIFGENRRQISEDKEIESRWELIKRAEKGRKSIIKDLPRDLPTTAKAVSVQKAAAKAGAPIDAPPAALSLARADGETDEQYELRVGELLMTLLHHINKSGTDPESALRRAVTRFTEKVQRLEAAAGDVPLDTLGREATKELWDA